MASSTRGKQDFRNCAWAGWIVLSAMGIYAYAILAAAPDRLVQGALAMAFQIACWTIALVLLTRREPTGHLRLCDPGVLVMLWGAIYLIYPSIVWFQADPIPFSNALSLETGVLLFWLHGLFFLGFTAGYLGLCGRPSGGIGKLDTQDLPSGWLFFLIPFIPLLWSTLTRVASGGGLFPAATYGEATIGGYAELEATRSAGGLDYLWAQIYSKVAFYPIIMQGVGTGLILIRTIKRRQGRLRTCLFLSLGILFTLFAGSGRRTEVFFILAIALIFVDMIIGPLPWRKLAAVALVGLVIFEFFGYFRANRGLGFSLGLWESYQSLLTADRSISLGEFTLMLSKEALAVKIFRAAGIEGPMYLVQSVLLIVPSQLLPGKFDWTPTRDILTKEMIGQYAAASGIGAAGTMVGDGFRFADIPGVLLLAVILGSAFGLTQRWLASEVRRGIQGPILLKAVLVAGLYGWTYNTIRTDLAEVIYIFFYNLIVPWLVLSVFLPERGLSVWTKPLAVKSPDMSSS